MYVIVKLIFVIVLITVRTLSLHATASISCSESCKTKSYECFVCITSSPERAYIGIKPEASLHKITIGNCKITVSWLVCRDINTLGAVSACGFCIIMPSMMFSVYHSLIAWIYSTFYIRLTFICLKLHVSH